MGTDDKDLPGKLPASEIPDNFDELMGGVKDEPYTPFNEELDRDYSIEKYFPQKI